MTQKLKRTAFFLQFVSYFVPFRIELYAKSHFRRRNLDFAYTYNRTIFGGMNEKRGEKSYTCMDFPPLYVSLF